MFPKFIQVGLYLGGEAYIRGDIFRMLIGLHIWGAYFGAGRGLLYEGRIIGILRYISARKNSGCIFSLNQLENIDVSGNKKSAVCD